VALRRNPLTGLIRLGSLGLYLWALQAQAEPVRVALLPLIGSNAAARQAKLSESVTEAVRGQLINRQALRLINTKTINAFFRKNRELWTERRWKDCALKMQADLAADFVLIGSVVRYGTTVESTYIDIRTYEAQTGELVGWVCERGDRVRVASMTISSPASEQMERLGSYIAAAVRRARSAQPASKERVPVAVLPFKESAEDVYGEAVARMFATDLMNHQPYRVLSMPRVPADLDEKGRTRWARERGAKYVFFGEVVSSESNLNQLRAAQIETATGRRLRSASETYASDVDLRIATADLAWRFGPGGERMLWRWHGEPSATPYFAEGKLFVGANGRLAALSPLAGRELWVFAPERVHGGIGDRFFSPILFGEKLCAHGPAGAGTLTFDPKKGTMLEYGRFSGGQGSVAGERILADEKQIYLTSGTFHLTACAMTEDELLAVQWRYADRSSLMLSHGRQQGHVVVASRNGKLTALAKKDGEVVWQRHLSDRVFAAPLTHGDRVYVACEDGSRVCLCFKDGSIIWSQKDKGRCMAVAAATDDEVYFANEPGDVTCYHATDGDVQWKCTLGSAARGALVLYRGSLHASTTDGRFHCIHAETGKGLWKANLRGHSLGAPVPVPVDALSGDLEDDPAEWMENYDHAIFVSSSDGHLYAIGGNVVK